MVIHELRPDIAFALQVAYRALVEVLGTQPAYYADLRVERPTIGRDTYLVSCLDLSGADPLHRFQTTVTVKLEPVGQMHLVEYISVLVKNKDGSEPTGLAAGYGKETTFVTSMPGDDMPRNTRLLSLYGISVPHAA